VAQVVDGDTIDLDFGRRRERVRLLGVDAPESVHPTVPVQCFGAEASAALGELLPSGSVVRVERDVEARDRYDRLLLYVYRADDDLFVNRWLLDNGLADTAFYDPNTTRATELTKARGGARAGRIGLWGRCDGPDQPLDESTP
jgi:micrococcal nuclease